MAKKSTPIPKFLGIAEAYFVCHIGPNFQISLIYALGVRSLWPDEHADSPSIRNRAVCSKRPFLLGTLAQLSRTVRQAARTPGANRAAVQTSVPRRKASLDYTGRIDLL